MNPHGEPTKETIDLPPVPAMEPKFEQPITPQNAPELSPEIKQAVPASPAPSSTPAAPVADNTQVQSQTPQQSPVTDNSTDAFIADDADLIEKEWVERAKDIVHKTKDNPYLQNKAITKMKADYIKKRYNKDIRVQED